jgi:single-stranded-DNA-specific exonuclease
LVRHLLWHRGLRSEAEANDFMTGVSVDNDPMLLPDAGQAIERLRKAIREDELIAVYGDFDVDGVTASAILIECLRRLGGRVEPYIPDRFSEGYGVNTAAIDALGQKGVRVIVTADCGTSSVDEVAHAGGLGIDTIVVDHHTVPPRLPEAVAIVNPKRADNRYPETELASGGLAFRLMSALYEAEGRKWQAERYLDLVALSTVCDMAPLRGENRSLVRKGLEAISNSTRPGLQALMEASGVDSAGVDADSIGYALGPRLNAAGRLAHARLSLDLLMEADVDAARRRAQELTALNKQRQDATTRALNLTRELLADVDDSERLIFVGHPDIPSGIVGLVAGRLTEEHYLPSIVYEQGESTSRASCRSIPEFDITGALRRHGELMVRFGGHRAAAGFTVENSNLTALKEAIVAEAKEALGAIDLAPTINVDAAIPLHRVDGGLIRIIGRMAPFGQENPVPTFLSRDLEVVDARALGPDGHHLRLKLRDRNGNKGAVTWHAVAFGVGADRIAELDLKNGQRYDVVYSFSADRGSNGGLELMIRDLAPASVAVPAVDVGTGGRL